MAVCSRPYTGYRYQGKVVFERPSGHSGACFPVNCGKCFSCILERQSQMARRMVRESRLHEESWFVTPTYSDDFCPEWGELVERHAQLFVKRLRQQLVRDARAARVPAPRIRYVYSGERGESTDRPHFHFILYGLPLRDLKHWAKSRSDGSQLWTSKWLEDIWGMGRVVVGAVSLETCRYVASYIVQGADDAPIKDFSVLDVSTGEIIARRRPFARYSTHPGIGAYFVDRYGAHALKLGYEVEDGRKLPLDRYALNRLAERYPDEVAALKAERIEAACTPQAKWNTSLERRRVREVVLKARLRLGSPGGMLDGES